MKYLSSLFVVALCFSFSFTMQAQVKWGVKAGMNMSKAHFDSEEIEGEENIEIKTKLRFAYHVGVTTEYDLTEKISLQSGLLFTSKGYNGDLSEEHFTKDSYTKVTLNYLEIPVHFTYKINNFQVYAGPYLAIGVGGRAKYELISADSIGGSRLTIEGDDKIKPTFGKVKEDEDSDGNFRAIDYGINGGIGYQFGPVLLNLGYSFGLGNIVAEFEEDDDDEEDINEKINNRVISISATYMISK